VKPLVVFLGFSSLFFSNVFIVTNGGFEHDLFLCPLMIHFEFCFFGLNLDPLSFPLMLGVLFNGVCPSLIISLHQQFLKRIDDHNVKL
jgi:hypothetical protein